MKTLTGIVTFFSPIGYMFLLIGLAMFLDTFFGRWAARKYAKKNNLEVRKHLTSSKTFEGILRKMAVYGMVMFSIFLIDDAMLNVLMGYFFPNFPFHYVISNVAGLFIIFHEADSIDEKVYNATGFKIREIFMNGVKRLKRFVSEVVKFKNDLKQN